MATSSNTYLIQQLKQGNCQAFDTIYQQYHQPLYYLALRYLKKESLAEDALQDVFLKLWQQRTQLNEHLPLKGLLFTSMKHYLLNAIRKHKNEIIRHAVFVRHQALASNSTEDIINYAQSQQLIEQGIGTLPAKKKQISELSLLQGLSNQEIAHKLNLSEHTVRSQISQSTRLLRRFLEKITCLLLFCQL